MRRFFKQAWDDLRNGENIDVYITTLASLILVAAGIVDWPQGLLMAVIFEAAAS